MSANYRRILIVRLSHLGDVVHALPVFHALRGAYPEAEIAWAVQPEFAGLLEGLPGLARIFRFDRRGGVRAWSALMSEVRGWEPDWAIDAQGNAKSALATVSSGAGRRSGLDPRDWREPFAARVLTDCASPVGGSVAHERATAHAPAVAHAMDRMIALARHVAPDASEERVRQRDLALTPEELAAGRTESERWLPSNGTCAAILALSSPGDVRAWPLEHFERLARLLDAGGKRVVVLSGPAEEREGRELEHRLAEAPRIRHWVGQRGLRALAAFFTASGARGARFIGCDSGPMHLAAASGLCVVCLSGPQDPRRTGPWPLERREPFENGHRALRAPIELDCAPCLERRCAHPQGPLCMSRIEPEFVLESLANG